MGGSGRVNVSDLDRLEWLRFRIANDETVKRLGPTSSIGQEWLDDVASCLDHFSSPHGPALRRFRILLDRLPLGSCPTPLWGATIELLVQAYNELVTQVCTSPPSRPGDLAARIEAIAADAYNVGHRLRSCGAQNDGFVKLLTDLCNEFQHEFDGSASQLTTDEAGEAVDQVRRALWDIQGAFYSAAMARALQTDGGGDALTRAHDGLEGFSPIKSKMIREFRRMRQKEREEEIARSGSSTINAGRDVYVQQGGTGNRMTVTNAGATLSELAEIIKQLRSAALEELAPENRGEVIELTEEIDAEISSPSPSLSRVRNWLTRAKEIASSAKDAVVVGKTVAEALQLLSQL